MDLYVIHPKKRILTGFSLLILILLSINLSGCGDTAGADSGKKSTALLDQAQRQILASRQEINLKDSEISQAGSSRNSKSLGARFATRIEGDAGLTEFDQNFESLVTEMSQVSPQDDQANNAITYQLVALTNEFLGSHGQFVMSTKEDRQQTEKTLNQAVSAAKASGSKKGIANAYLMLGINFLKNARESREELFSYAFAIKARQLDLSNTIFSLKKQRAYYSSLDYYFPSDKMISQLKNRIDGQPEQASGPANYEEQLQETIGIIAGLEEKLEGLEEKLKNDMGMAKQLDREYFSIIEQAEQTKGDQYYDLNYEALKIRNSQDQDDIIKYATSIEKLENEINVLSTQLNYQIKRRDQLQKEIDDINRGVEEIKKSELHGIMQDAIDVSGKKKDDLIRMVQAGLDELAEMEKTYAAIRVESIESYRKSQNAFSQAASADRLDRHMSNYVSHMGNLINNELVAGAEQLLDDESDIDEDEFDPAEELEMFGEEEEEGDELEGEEELGEDDEDVGEDDFEGSFIGQVLQDKLGVWAIDIMHYTSNIRFLSYINDIAELQDVAAEMLVNYEGQIGQASNSVAEIQQLN